MNERNIPYNAYLLENSEDEEIQFSDEDEDEELDFSDNDPSGFQAWVPAEVEEEDDTLLNQDITPSIPREVPGDQLPHEGNNLNNKDANNQKSPFDKRH
jgi:hypothetical protein